MPMLHIHPYLTKIRDHFKEQSKIWEFFSTRTSNQGEYDDFNNVLLKNAYRMNPDSEPDVYAKLDEVKTKLEITIPITLYQLQNSSDINAFISFQQQEAYLVFSGPILKLLQGAELTALISHELSHIKLFTIDNGDYHITNRIITSIANDARSESVFLETARYFRLYTEIFCDLGALIVTGSEEIAQTSLIKIHTGLEQVSAPNYLQQAKEIFLNDSELKSEGDTHPENFIRVLALHLHNSSPEISDSEISKLVEFRYDMDRLDIFRQEKLAIHTKYLLKEFVAARWMQTDAILAMCSQYFSDFHSQIKNEWQWEANMFNENVREYFSYILLDVAMVDPQMENVPLGRALNFSEQFGFKKEFNSILKKEYKLSDKRLRELQTAAIESVSKLEN